jgi:Sensors of blue-light using FAD
MKLTRLIYASVTRSEMSYAELTAVLRTAEAHNSQHGITGILCYSDGKFLQALEGDRDVVNRLYNRIVRDPRHEDCTILRYGRVTSRHYDDWSMKLVGLDDQPTAFRRALVMKYSGSHAFDPLHLTGSQASALLEALAHATRQAA